MADRLPLFIGGQFVASESNEILPVTDPASQEVLSYLPFATRQEIDRAVASARDTFAVWRETPTPERARLMLRYQHLLKKHQDDIARILSRETGKTFADAQGDVWRGIEVVEHAGNIASLMMGETVENVARRIDTCSYTQPIGVCAGITPFNFPAMIPLWMFPLAIACGNTFVLKALGAGSDDTQPPGRAFRRCRRSPRRIAGDSRRAGASGCTAHPPRYQGHFLRRFGAGGGARLPDGHPASEAGAGLGRSQESHGGDAGCRQEAGYRQSGRRVLRCRRPTLHGHQRGGLCWRGGGTGYRNCGTPWRPCRQVPGTTRNPPTARRSPRRHGNASSA